MSVQAGPRPNSRRQAPFKSASVPASHHNGTRRARPYVVEFQAADFRDAQSAAACEADNHLIALCASRCLRFQLGQHHRQFTAGLVDDPVCEMCKLDSGVVMGTLRDRHEYRCAKGRQAANRPTSQKNGFLTSC